MSQEQAEQILEALESDEEALRKKLIQQEMRKQKRMQTDKDW